MCKDLPKALKCPFVFQKNWKWPSRGSHRPSREPLFFSCVFSKPFGAPPWDTGSGIKWVFGLIWWSSSCVLSEGSPVVRKHTHNAKLWAQKPRVFVTWVCVSQEIFSKLPRRAQRSAIHVSMSYWKKMCFCTLDCLSGRVCRTQQSIASEGQNLQG